MLVLIICPKWEVKTNEKGNEWKLKTVYKDILVAVYIWDFLKRYFKYKKSKSPAKLEREKVFIKYKHATWKRVLKAERF